MRIVFFGGPANGLSKTVHEEVVIFDLTVYPPLEVMAGVEIDQTPQQYTYYKTGVLDSKGREVFMSFMEEE
jgi:hypothetical protein